MDMPAITPSHSPASRAVTAAENPTGTTSYSKPWSWAIACKISRSMPTISPFSFSNSKGAKVVSVLMMYFLPEAAPLVSSSAADSAAVVSAFAAVSAAVVPVAVVSAGLEPHPATVNAMTAAMDNAINFFIITSSSTDRNKIRVTLINLSPLTCDAPASSRLLYHKDMSKSTCCNSYNKKIVPFVQKQDRTVLLPNAAPVIPDLTCLIFRPFPAISQENALQLPLYDRPPKAFPGL